MKHRAIYTVGMIALVAGIAILVVLTAHGPSTGLQDRIGQVLSDVTYCTVDGVALKMDLYFPTKLSGIPAPVAVYVHGGGWWYGDKKSGEGMADIPTLRERGYLVVSVNYRLYLYSSRQENEKPLYSKDFKFPVQIQDVKCAVRYLRANAAEYGLDSNEIGAWGESAGGHLVSLLGLTDKTAGWDTGQYSDQSSRVQAVVDYYGPVNLTDPYLKLHFGRLFTDEFGSDDGLRIASPINYISPDDPPFLIVQGKLDTTVPPAHSEDFFGKLKAGGVSAALVMVEYAGHKFTPVEACVSPIPGGGGQFAHCEMTPSRQEITQAMADFFDRNLRGPLPVLQSPLQSGSLSLRVVIEKFGKSVDDEFMSPP